jgi:hypothetical protein
MINPYDLGEFNLLENCMRVSVDSLIKEASKGLKLKLILSKIEISGFAITLTTSCTRFGGTRLWFLCPLCKKRKGVLFKKDKYLGCRNCLRLKYRKQRFNRMIEDTVIL